MICLSYTYDENVDIYGTYDFKEENDKVVSVQLNAFYEGESFMVAEITDIVVEENNGIIDIAFTFDFKIDLSDFDIACTEDLSKSYAAEKDEPMEGTLTADENSEHYKLVGKYIATSFSGSNGESLSDFLIDSCIEYDYNFETQEEIETIDEDCTPPDTIQLELSTYGTYLYMELAEKTPLCIERGKWYFGEDLSNFIIASDYDDDEFSVSISNLTNKGMTMTIVKEDDEEVYTGIYTWEKR